MLKYLLFIFMFIATSCSRNDTENQNSPVFNKNTNPVSNDSFSADYAKHGIKELKIEIDGGKIYRLVEFSDGRVHIEGVTDPKKLNIQEVYTAISDIRAFAMDAMPADTEDFYMADGKKMKLPKAVINITFSGGIKEKLELTGLRRAGSSSMIARKGELLMELPIKEGFSLIAMEKEN